MRSFRHTGEKYDLVIGGAGLYGATLAHFAHKRGKRVLVIENKEVGGMCADPDNYARYGPHIFHTNDRALWEWVNKIDHFIPIHHSPLVCYKDELYSFPINKLTLHQLGYDTRILEYKGDNFEQACIYAVGGTIYEKFFYHYTKKMWGREPRDLPISILSRIPARTDYNTSYYDDRYVGVPINGYTNFITKLLAGVEVREGDFLDYKEKGRKIFTGSVDAAFQFKLGELPYRGLKFESVDSIDAMVINYTDSRPWIRDTNYSYLGYRNITIRETPGEGRFYPCPWGADLYNEYRKLKTDIEFEGRLGSYRYMNMNDVITEAYLKSKTL